MHFVKLSVQLACCQAKASRLQDACKAKLWPGAGSIDLLQIFQKNNPVYEPC